MRVSAVEARDAEVAVREVCAGAGSGLVGAVGAVAVVVVDLRGGDGDGWMGETGECVFGGGGVEFGVWGVVSREGGREGEGGTVPSGETPRGTAARARDALEEIRIRRLFWRMFGGGGGETQLGCGCGFVARWRGFE